MRLLTRIKQRFKRETRAKEPSWMHLTGIGTGNISGRMAETLSTVHACVSAISTAIGSLPATIYRKTEHGRENDHNHPLNELIKNGPNQWQTWADWVEWTMAQVLLNGNALSRVNYDYTGKVTELRPIPWNSVNPQMNANGRLLYDVTEVQSIYGSTGKMERLLDSDVMHLRDRTDDGLIGVSRLKRAYPVIDAALSIQEFSSSIYKNGLNPSGVLSYPNRIDTELGALIREYVTKFYGGPSNAGVPMILSEGGKWQQLTINPVEAQMLESRRFCIEELARLYQVPPPIIGDLTNGTFTNAETTGRWFAQFCLSPWIRKLESEFSRSVLTAETRQTHEVDLDLSGFLRGDHTARWQSHEIAVKNNILTKNEVRAQEGYNYRPDGDSLTDNQATA